MSVLSATYARAPAACAHATADGTSSSAKFSARCRSPKRSHAKYTASAPNRTAASKLRPPAGGRQKLGSVVSLEHGRMPCLPRLSYPL